MKRFPSCLLATCCIPWDEKDNFVEDVFRHQVHLMQQGTKHLYLFGTAGEGYAVNEQQFDQIVRVFVDAMKAGKADPMVGVINLSLPTMLERIRRAREMGVRKYQISLPSWGALTEKELFTFFREVCGRFPDCQFLHYNLMRTKRLVTPTEYAKLADENPNLVATKNSSDAMDRIEELILKSPQLQHFVPETAFAYGSFIGECGLLCSLATLNWKSGQQFFDAAKGKNMPLLQEMMRELSGLVRDLMGVVGDQAHMDGAYDKMFCRLHDPRFPLRLLPPYQYVSDESFEKFKTIVREKYPRWAV